MATNQASTIIDTIASHYSDTVKLLSTPRNYVDNMNIHFDLVVQIGALLYKEFGVEVADETIDVDKGLIMAENLFNYIYYLKIKKKYGNSISVDKYGAKKLKSPDINPEKHVLVATMFETLNEREKDAYKLFDFKVMMPIVAEITNLESAMEELHLGFDTIPEGLVPFGVQFAKKRSCDRVAENAPLSVLNLTALYAPLLHGLTFSVQRRLALLTSLGPMTLAAMLLSTPVYHQGKMKKAFFNSINHLPMAREITDCLSLRNDNWAGLMKTFGDLLLTTHHRNSQRYYFPLELYIQAYYSMGKGGLNGSFSSNGVEMQKIYCRFISYNWLIRCESGQEDFLKEYLFHAMFTGGMECLDILAVLTNHTNWHRRRDLNDCVRARSNQPIVSINPVAFNYVGTRALRDKYKTPTGQIYGQTVYGGFRRRFYSPQFLHYFETGEREIQYYPDVNRLLPQMDELLTYENDMERKRYGNWERVVYGEMLNFVAAPDSNLHLISNKNSQNFYE